MTNFNYLLQIFKMNKTKQDCIGKCQTWFFECDKKKQTWNVCKNEVNGCLV